MAEALGDVAAAVPHGRLGAVGLERRIVEEDGIPQRQAPAHAERPFHVRFAVLLRHGRHAALQVGVSACMSSGVIFA